MTEPVELLKKYNRIPKIYRYTFWGTFLTGILTHLYVLTNKLPTSDDILCLYSFGGSFGLGRWFLGILGLLKYKILGNYSMPALNGILTILLLAVFACLVNLIFENDNVLTAVLTGVMIVVFPTIAGNLIYMFTGYYYSLAIILTGAGVLLIKRGQKCWWLIAGSFLLTLSLGIYQAYFPLAIGLLLSSLILDTLKGNRSFRELLKEGFRYLLGLILALGFYFPLNKIWLKVMNTEMASYRGMDRMGKIVLREIPDKIALTYKAFIQMLLSNYCGMTGNIWIRLSIFLLLMITLFFLIKKSIQLLKQKKYLICSILWVFILLFPIGIHSIYIMIEGEALYTLMIYADVLLFVFPLMLCEQIVREERADGSISKMTGILNWLTTCIMIFSAIFYIYLDNAAYLKMELSFSAAKSYYTTLITQIKSQEGYREDMEVVLIGENQDSTIYKMKEDIFQEVEIAGVLDTEWEIRGIDQELFMKYYCGYDQNITDDISTIDKEKWQDMPHYPNDGSIKIVDDKVIVKYSDVK